MSLFDTVFFEYWGGGTKLHLGARAGWIDVHTYWNGDEKMCLKEIEEAIKNNTSIWPVLAKFGVEISNFRYYEENRQYFDNNPGILLKIMPAIKYCLDWFSSKSRPIFEQAIQQTA